MGHINPSGQNYNILYLPLAHHWSSVIFDEFSSWKTKKRNVISIPNFKTQMPYVWVLLLPPEEWRHFQKPPLSIVWNAEKKRGKGGKKDKGKINFPYFGLEEKWMEGKKINVGPTCFSFFSSWMENWKKTQLRDMGLTLEDKRKIIFLNFFKINIWEYLCYLKYFFLFSHFLYNQIEGKKKFNFLSFDLLFYKTTK